MKKVISLFVLLPVVCALTSCASYNAESLNSLSPTIHTTAKQPDHILMVAKEYSKADCRKYLDRNVISKGFQPVQLYIDNQSEKSYLFSPDRVSLPIATADEVARKVHTSTIGRVTAYGTAAILTIGLLAIPAVVDGVKSYHANQALDKDYTAKIAEEQIIQPYSHSNKILFVPVSGYKPKFSVTLIDQSTHTPEVFEVKAGV